MFEGKFIFSQLMDFVPWRRLQTCIDRYGGDYKIQTYPCAEQFRVMAFAQLTYRHSLREVETCLRAVQGKLLPFGHSQLGFTQQYGLCQPHTRLANLRRLRSNPNPESQATLSGRKPRIRSRRHRVRFGRHNNRLMSFSIPLGQVSSYQGRGQATHPAESPRRYPRVHLDIRRETARRQCFGSPRTYAWRVL
jgi:hypothetical protein